MVYNFRNLSKKMKPLNEYINEYKKQLAKGTIQIAYQGLIEYIMSLKTHLKNNYPQYLVAGNLYQGYMDMTYFSLNPESFKKRKLRIAIVFVYETFRFEVWLAGYNKNVQLKYWELFKQSNWNKYKIPSTIKGSDSIIEYVLVDNPDFSNFDTLTKQIEKGTIKFVKDIESILFKHLN